MHGWRVGRRARPRLGLGRAVSQPTPHPPLATTHPTYVPGRLQELGLLPRIKAGLDLHTALQQLLHTGGETPARGGPKRGELQSHRRSAAPPAVAAGGRVPPAFVLQARANPDSCKQSLGDNQPLAPVPPRSPSKPCEMGHKLHGLGRDDALVLRPDRRDDLRATDELRHHLGKNSWGGRGGREGGGGRGASMQPTRGMCGRLGRGGEVATRSAGDSRRGALRGRHGSVAGRSGMHAPTGPKAWSPQSKRAAIRGALPARGGVPTRAHAAHRHRDGTNQDLVGQSPPITRYSRVSVPRRSMRRRNKLESGCWGR